MACKNLYPQILTIPLTDWIRVELAKDLIADVRRIDDNSPPTPRRSPHYATSTRHQLRDAVGIRAVLAARLLGRTGPASRFASAAARSAARYRSVVRFQGCEASCCGRIAFRGPINPNLAALKRNHHYQVRNRVVFRCFGAHR